MDIEEWLRRLDLPQYIKHALVQDAAYSTLLRGRRQELHARVAAVLEEHFPDLVERQPELLANHLTAAGNTEPAVEQWHKAGERALQRSANVEASAHLRTAIGLIASFPAAEARPAHLGYLASTHASAGDPGLGLRLLEQAIRTTEETEERVFEAELHRLRGELLIQSGRSDEAEVEFDRALDIARRQQARMWELRAATSLARLWGEQGRRAEASDLLAPVYGRFTEGFDTADLMEAKALLDELA